LIELQEVEMSVKAMLSSSLIALVVGTAALAQSSSVLLNAVPQNGQPVTNFYKQSVYDPNDGKIGEVTDLIVQSDGKIAAAMIGVGGLLGVGEKDVAVPFDALHTKTKDNKTYLVMDTTKDALKNAPGFKYDRSQGKWIPAKSS
jgi:hypothetical protein